MKLVYLLILICSIFGFFFYQNHRNRKISYVIDAEYKIPYFKNENKVLKIKPEKPKEDAIANAEIYELMEHKKPERKKK